MDVNYYEFSWQKWIAVHRMEWLADGLILIRISISARCVGMRLYRLITVETSGRYIG